MKTAIVGMPLLCTNLKDCLVHKNGPRIEPAPVNKWRLQQLEHLCFAKTPKIAKYTILGSDGSLDRMQKGTNICKRITILGSDGTLDTLSCIFSVTFQHIIRDTKAPHVGNGVRNWTLFVMEQSPRRRVSNLLFCPNREMFRHCTLSVWQCLRPYRSTGAQDIRKKNPHLSRIWAHTTSTSPHNGVTIPSCLLQFCLFVQFSVMITTAVDKLDRNEPNLRIYSKGKKKNPVFNLFLCSELLDHLQNCTANWSRVNCLHISKQILTPDIRQLAMTNRNGNWVDWVLLWRHTKANSTCNHPHDSLACMRLGHSPEWGETQSWHGSQPAIEDSPSLLHAQQRVDIRSVGVHFNKVKHSRNTSIYMKCTQKTALTSCYGPVSGEVTQLQLPGDGQYMALNYLKTRGGRWQGGQMTFRQWSGKWDHSSNEKAISNIFPHLKTPRLHWRSDDWVC